MATVQETDLKKEPKEKSLLGKKEMFAWFGVNLGNIPIQALITNFLLLFYVDVVGLNPISVGTLFLAARIMDGLSDPINGYIVDHLPRTKMGRFRLYIIIGVVIASLNYVVVWLGPSMATVGKLTIAWVSYLLLGWTFDFMDIPLNSMIPVMSDRNVDRNNLSTVKMAGYMVGMVLFSAGTMPFVKAFPTERQGFHWLVILAAIFVVIVSVLGALGIKERFFPIKEERYTFKDIKNILLAKPVLIFFLAMIALMIEQNLVMAVKIFFFTYVLKRVDLFPLASMSLLVGLVVAGPLAPRMIRRFGRKNLWTWGTLINMLGIFILFFIPASSPMMFVILPMVFAPATVLTMIMAYAIQADNQDYIEWKLGKRADGAVASMVSFIIKASGGIGGAIAAYLLPVIKYVPNAPTQSAETIRGFYFLNFALPAALLLFTALIWAIGYPLTKKVQEQMMQDLAERRQQASAE